MKIAKKIAAGALAATLTFTSVGLAACGDDENTTPVNYPTEIVNGGFEEIGPENTWKGWTRSGSAFQVSGIVESAPGTVVDKTGRKFFYGLEGGTSAMTGTLTSDPFKLTGTGKIAFKMGAGKDGGKVYVEFVEVGGGTLLKMSNTDFDATYRTDLMVRKIADLSAYVNKNIYIRITDNDKSTADEYGYVNLDDFVICKTEADVTKYQTERTNQLKMYSAPEFTEDENNTTIDNGGFETGDLTNWKILEGKAFVNTNVKPMSTRYWGDRAVYGHGEYYLDGLGGGAIAESERGAIRSQKFTLAGDGYITFMMGAGKSNCYVAICDAETDDELITETNDGFNDPARAQMLLRRYVDASEYIGRKLYIKVVDNGMSDFGFINVDDFRVSMTEAEVKTLQNEQYEAAMNETYTGNSYDDIAALKEYYRGYDYLFPLEVPLFTAYAQNLVVAPTNSYNLATAIEGAAAKYGDVTEGVTISVVKVEKGTTVYTTGFDAFDLSEDGKYTVTYEAEYNGKVTSAQLTLLVHSDEHSVANGGFETGDLTGWTVLTAGWGTSNGHPTGVINAQTWWGEEMPYNQSGDYHLDGWNNGIGEADAWTVRSTVFTLGGSGWISVKMGGKAAAVKVYKEDNTLIGYYKQTRFSDAGFPHLSEGGSWADMATYVMDLHEHLNERLYIELCDEQVEGGWAHAFFDDVITYYETAPNWQDMFDTVKDGHRAGEEAQDVNIAWVLAENEIQDLSGVRITTRISNKSDVEAGTVDLTEYLAEAAGSLIGADANTLVKSIVKVNDGARDYTTGFDSFTLVAGKTYTVTYRIADPSDGSNYAEDTFTITVASVYQVENGGFETGDLTGWTVLTDGWKMVDGKPAGVISAQTYWGEELPYNQGGNYHLDGWETGIAENATWAIRSSNFTLGGSGWITVKMGGNAAAVKVFKADGTLIGYYKQTRFNDTGFPDVSKGSWADMATYAMDLHEYIGEELYIELHDIEVGAWAHAFFDDVITYYETAPDWENNKDTVKNGGTTDTVDIPWVKATNLVTNED